MKKYLLAPLLLLAACGTKTTETSTTETTKPAETAAAAPAAPAGMDLDLTPYGAPLTMHVPEGTTAEKHGDAGVFLKGPKLLMRVSAYPGDQAAAIKKMKEAKANVAPMGLTHVILEEPMALRIDQPGHPEMDIFLVDVAPATGGKYYEIDMQNDVMNPKAGYTTADRDAMLAVARTAKAK